MNDQEFARLIEKYEKGLLSSKEKMLLDEWFDAMGEENSSPVWMEEDATKLKRKILNRIRSSDRSITMQPTPTSNRFRMVFRAAAAVALLIASAYVVWQYTATEKDDAVTLRSASSGSVDKIALADGTLVWLKGNSTLTYPSSFDGNTREVSLQGEALFEVAKDPNHPFTIRCGELITTVLGTSFNIRSIQKNIEVVVLTGKVSLTSATDKEGIIVLPNEKAVYNGERKQLAKVETHTPEKVAAMAGTDYDMNFEDTQLKEVIRRIEGKFDVKVLTTDPKVGNCMITANFTDQSLDRTLNMVAQVHGFEYEIKEKTVTIKGKGCD